MFHRNAVAVKTCGSAVWLKLQSCSPDREEGSEGPHGDRKKRGTGEGSKKGGFFSEGGEGDPPYGSCWAEWQVHSRTCRHPCNHQHFSLCDIRKSLPPKLFEIIVNFSGQNTAKLLEKNKKIFISKLCPRHANCEFPDHKNWRMRMLQFLSLSILLTNCLLRKLERTITCIFAIQLCQQSSPSTINMLMMMMTTTIMVMLGFITTGVLCIPPDSLSLKWNRWSWH